VVRVRRNFRLFGNFGNFGRLADSFGWVVGGPAFLAV